MKPVNHKVMPDSFWMSGDLQQEFGKNQTIANIKGSVRKLGNAYQGARIILYAKVSFLPLAIREPDQNGEYQFLGLNTDLKTFIVAFDKKQQFNAVIQDNVVPK